MSVLIEFSMFPISAQEQMGSSVSKYVSRIISAIDKIGREVNH